MGCRAVFSDNEYVRVLLQYKFTILRAGIPQSLRAGRSGDRIPVGARFSAPDQTGPGAHPASYTMGTDSFPGVKRPGHGVDHSGPSSAEVKERVEPYLYSTSGPSWTVLGWALPLLTFYPSPRNLSVINPLAPEFSFKFLAHPVFKMWIIQEP